MRLLKVAIIYFNCISYVTREGVYFAPFLNCSWIVFGFIFSYLK